MTEKALIIYNLPLHEAYITKNAIIINIKIPLIGDKFECEKIQPIPIGNEVLETDIEFIGWNHTTNVHILLTREEKNQNCIKYESASVCKLDIGYMKTTSVNECEFDAALNNKNNSDCNWKKMKQAEKWLKMHDHQWLYWSSKSINEVTLKCESGEYNVALETKSMIKLQERCTIETNRSIIHQHFIEINC